MSYNDLYIMFLQAANAKADCVMIQLENGAIETFGEKYLDRCTWFGGMPEDVCEVDGKACYTVRSYSSSWVPGFDGHFYQEHHCHKEHLAIVDALY